jgi:hypothetical protein
MRQAVAVRISRVLSLFFLVAVAGLVAAGCYLYLVWSSSPQADRTLLLPYENFLLYTEHYDWVQAPFLQAFQAASVCGIFVCISLLLPRMAKAWKVWSVGAVFIISIQIAVFNMVVSTMAGYGWLYSVYLAMSWFEPWLVLTLAGVGDGLYSTGGIAGVAMMSATLALLALRRKHGLAVAILEATLFLCTSLFVFELGIMEYKPTWWDFRVTDVQSSLGIPWLTNHMLFSSVELAVPTLVLVRVGLWTAEKVSDSRSLNARRERLSG